MQQMFPELIVTTKGFKRSHVGGVKATKYGSDSILKAVLDVMLLGKCDCFLGSRTSGTVAALIMGQQEQIFETWNYGRYHVDDRWQIW